LKRPDKREVLAAVRAALRADLDDVVRSQKAAHEGATHEESRPENDKDTRGLEASYLARGLAKRADELDVALKALGALPTKDLDEDAPIDVGALVFAEDDDGEVACYLVAPVAGGLSVDVGGLAIKLITPASPIGQAFLEKRRDDDVQVRTPGGVRELVITAVA
jgi:transcription elongation GreA/GreB family factor